MKKKLTELQAYNAMAKLFQIYYELDSTGDLCEILGVMSFLQDKKTADLCMLEDWKKSLDRIVGHKNLRNYNYLTPLEGFCAIGLFLENFFRTTNLAKDVDFLEKNADLANNKQQVDSVLWKNWLKCIDEVLAVKDSRMYFGWSKKINSDFNAKKTNKTTSI